MTKPLTPIRLQHAVAVDETGRWIDGGQWRERGVTHWHLIEPREWSITDNARFDTDRVRAERVRSSAGVARSPHEVLAWLSETTWALVEAYSLGEGALRQSGLDTSLRRRALDETRFWMAMHGMDLCSMLATRDTQIIHYSAYAMTALQCTAPH